MTKTEKIRELEKELDQLTDKLRDHHQCPDRIGIMITKEIIQAQITALNWEFDNSICECCREYVKLTHCTSCAGRY